MKYKVTTPATSLFPTLPFMYSINTILLLLSISIRHSFTSFQDFISSLPFSLVTFMVAYTQTHANFFISTFQTAHSILDPFHPCAFMPCHTLADIRSAHPSFPISLLFHLLHTISLLFSSPSIFPYFALTPHRTFHPSTSFCLGFLYPHNIQPFS